MLYCSLALLTTAVAFTPGKPALRSTQSAQRASSASMMLYHHEAPMPKVVSDFASLALSKRKAETTPSKEIGGTAGVNTPGGDRSFDPLGLAPEDPAEFAEMQEKELAHARVGMVAAAGFLAQEAITKQTWGTAIGLPDF